MTSIYLNCSTAREFDRVHSLVQQFPDQIVVMTNQDLFLDRAEPIKVSNMNKTTVDWTKRFLRHFVETGHGDMVKIDPDTFVRRFPEIPKCDVAGDFRYHNNRWIWMGGFQYFTRDAVIKILNDEHYQGTCIYQDWALADSVRRLNLDAKNLHSVNCWGDVPDKEADVFHRGSIRIKRAELGSVEFNK